MIARRLHVRSPIQIEFCTDSTAEYLPKAIVDVTPYPPHIADGEHIDIVADIELGKAIEAGSTLELKLTKKGAISIPIPCMEVRNKLSYLHKKIKKMKQRKRSLDYFLAIFPDNKNGRGAVCRLAKRRKKRRPQISTFC